MPGYIGRHRDGCGDRTDNISAIVQLSPQEDYTGGEQIAMGEDTNLQVGDMGYWDYDTFHEVLRLTSGRRFVLNLRICAE